MVTITWDGLIENIIYWAIIVAIALILLKLFNKGKVKGLPRKIVKRFC